MKKKMLCALIAGALPGLAAANSSADEIRTLQQQIAVLQRQMSALQSQLGAKPLTVMPCLAYWRLSSRVRFTTAPLVAL